MRYKFKALIAPENQSADYIELFFDLVFVFAITKITHMTAHNLDFIHVAQSILTFWMIWWSWSQFTWSLNSADTRHVEIRIEILAATAVAFVMAVYTDQAFDDKVLWFAIPYIIVKLLGLGLFFRVTEPDDDSRSAAVTFTIASLFPLIAVLIGAYAQPTTRIFWWLGAIGLDLLAGYIGGKAQGWKLQSAHFAERHGLIVIIALGESLIVSASSIGDTIQSFDLLITGGMAVLLTFLLWWTYFSWINDFIEWHLNNKSASDRARLGRDAYSFLHFPLICGIIGMAVGFEKILNHPSEPLTAPVALALGGGVLLFLGSTAAVWRSGKHPLVPRLIICLVSSILFAFSIGHHSAWALGIIVVSLALMDVIEWKVCRIPH